MQPTGTFISDNIQLAYYESEPESETGAMKGPIILVHGFASNSHMNWINTGWFKHLNNAGYHVYSFDNRGHGESEKIYDAAQYGSDLMAHDIKALMDHVGIEKTHLMGYSMGTRISAFFAREYQSSLNSVILAGMGYNLIRGMGNPEPIARALEAEKATDVTNPAALSFRIFAEQTKSDLRALAACIRSNRSPLTVEMLGQIDIPALIAVGTTDVIAGSGEKLAKLIPGAIHLPIPNRDHMRAVGDEVYKEGVISFLQKQSTA